MKKIHLFGLLLFLTAACSQPGVTGMLLTGEIKGLGNDTLYLYGTDRWYDRMDTIAVTNDKFRITLFPDTFATTLLLFADGTTYPLFLDKTGALTIKGSADRLHSLQVKGNSANEEMTRFNREADSPAQPSAQMMEERVDTFIAQHPTSPASIYLLDKYFVQTEQPDLARIEQLANRMTGELKDTPYMTRLLKLLQDEEKVQTGKTAPFFRIKGTDGKDLTRANFKDKYLLIHFWASWDSLSRHNNAVYRRIYRQEQKKKKKERHLELIGVSLDADRQTWLETVGNDTLQWTQTCETAGWNGETVKQFMIRTIPANILLSPTGRIEAKNLDEAAIEQQIKEIDQREKQQQQQERERKQRERERRPRASNPVRR
ncbi:MAG: DUF4369 domain-containing protein [Prevotellaceae bacterium]|nr:DUF4369 domain-containing protein [Prevotellaceae bacterium]